MLFVQSLLVTQMCVALSNCDSLKKNFLTSSLDQEQAKVNKKLVKIDRITPSTILLFYNLIGYIEVILVVPSISLSITTKTYDLGNNELGFIFNFNIRRVVHDELFKNSVLIQFIMDLFYILLICIFIYINI